MSCRDAYKNLMVSTIENVNQNTVAKKSDAINLGKLLFGVDSSIQANDVLQNNLTEFDWVTRNKLYPNFWGRYISGENCLTKDEIYFLHSQGCKIVAIYKDETPKDSEDRAKRLAKKIVFTALDLDIPENTAVFLEIEESEKVTKKFMKTFANVLLSAGYVPGFKANTDAKYDFDREYSRGMQNDKEIFGKCLIWAVSPSLKEYERTTNSHLIHPDTWSPYAPSGILRKDIAIWQYGKECHPIEDDAGNETVFNVNLVCNEQMIIENMF